VRAGHTEGSVDLARLAGLREAAVICEVVNADGTMARLPDLQRFCAAHGLKMCTIEALIAHRRRREKLVNRSLAIKLPTRFGAFDLFVYESVVDPEPHLALCVGGVGVEVGGVIPEQSEPVLVRIHSQCLTGDLLGSLMCDCGSQLEQALSQIAEAGKGVLLYMRQEGRGIDCCPNCGPTNCSRRRDWTLSRPTSGSASDRTCVTTASAPRSCSTWAFGTCGC